MQNTGIAPMSAELNQKNEGNTNLRLMTYAEKLGMEIATELKENHTIKGGNC